MKHALILLAALLATPAAADISQAVDDLIMPGYNAFAEQAATLRDTAAQDCKLEAVRPAWNATFDAWLGVSHIRFGPVEQDGRAVSIAFWPDERGAGPRALAGLIADQDPIIETEGGTAQLSAAARGIYGLEHLLYDPQFAEAGAYGCALIRALSADLAQMAADVLADWQSGYATTLRTAGGAQNFVYLSEREGLQALFTALSAGLEFDADVRLGRPLGTYDRPRPNRAESRQSGRSQRNLELSLAALHALALSLSDQPLPQAEAAYARTMSQLTELDDPVFTAVDTPSGRIRLESVQTDLRTYRNDLLGELGPILGVTTGFNSADGD